MVGFNRLVKERLATIYWWQFVSADFFAKSLDSWNCCWMHCPAILELATKWAVLITQDVDRHSNSAKNWLLFQTSVMMPHYQMVGSEFKFMRSLKEAIMAKKNTTCCIDIPLLLCCPCSVEHQSCWVYCFWVCFTYFIFWMYCLYNSMT